MTQHNHFVWRSVEEIQTQALSDGSAALAFTMAQTQEAKAKRDAILAKYTPVDEITT